MKNNISKLPKEDLICTKNGKHSKWYISNGPNPIYIPKSNRYFAEKLAIKKYYTLKLEELLAEVSIIDEYIASYKKYNIKSEDLLEEYSSYKELLNSNFQLLPNNLQTWQNTSFDHNTLYPENLKYTTISGHKVRSKSEVIIANALYINQIPYRYECAVQIDNMVFYPDFTI